MIDGPAGMVKSTLIGALRYRLSDDNISASVSESMGLLDCLVNAKPLQKAHKASLTDQVTLLDTDYILELVDQYYSSGKLSDYETFSKAIELAALNLKPDLVVLVDSLSGSQLSSDLERGYIWEAKQRGYQIMSAIGDIEPVFEKILNLAKSSKVADPTAIGEIISKKPIQTKPKASTTKTSSQDKPNRARGSRRGRRR